MSVNEKMTAIADAIREKTGGTDALTLDGMAEAIPSVYEAGKDAEHKAFWDAVLPAHSATTGIGYAPYYFAGNCWSDAVFRPNKNIKFRSTSTGLFRQSSIQNLKSCLEECGVTLDLSEATGLSYAFAYGAHRYLPKISIVSAGAYVESLFGGDSGGNNLISIDEVEVAETNTFKNSFNYCKNLEHAIFTGTIATNGLNLQWSPLLDKESILSIIDCLKDYSEDTSGTYWYVTIGNENINKLTTEELEVAYMKGWDVK